MSEEEDGQQKDAGKGKTSRKNDTWTMEESNELLNLLVDGSIRIKYLLPRKKCGKTSLRIVVGNGTAVGRASFGVGTETDAPVYGLEDKRKSTLEDLSWNDETGTFTQSDYEYSLDQFDNTIDSQNQFDNTPRTKRYRSETATGTTFSRNISSKDQLGTTSSSNISSKDQLLEKICSDVHSMSNNFDAIRIAMEKRGALWDAMKEVPNIENQTRFKAMKLIVGRELKEMFIDMSPDERYEWIMFQMEYDT
ncbi:hypothetical protein MKW94_002270 [Papaver nudicaule]|uniref:At2g29880-like C-terminal domain-containing protein n=1 Tax=Papaver nudicaule TaxID=74823 RepID=A0AA41RL51_PAPNU|nr:hypothetical protein [Papaver nudicaule]